jgi:hypothetical protein
MEVLLRGEKTRKHKNPSSAAKTVNTWLGQGSAFSATIGSFVSCTPLDTEMPPGWMQLRLVMPFRDSR